MSTTTFVDGSTTIRASWLNDINNFFYTLFGGATTAAQGRTALALGNMALQDANSVAITGGTITSVTASGLDAPITVADGGTGAATHTTGSVLLGNGTSAFSEVAPGTSGNVLTSNGTTWTSAANSQQIFQGRFSRTDATHCKLAPYNGNRFFVNGALYTIPDGGVSVDTSGLSSSTVYYCYAYVSSGAIALEFSATGPAIGTGLGYPIKTGDATRTLVGIVRTNGSTQFVDTASQRFVRSYWNPVPTNWTNVFTTASRGNAAGAYAIINSEIRLEGVFFQNDMWDVSFSGGVGYTTGAGELNLIVLTALSFDGGSVDDGYNRTRIDATSDIEPVFVRVSKLIATDGYHYCDPYSMIAGHDGIAGSSGSSSTAYTAASLGDRCCMNATVIRS
jgi:hypothetical protein